MKRLSTSLVGVFAVGIVGMLCAGSASAQTPQFIQVSRLYFTMPVGSNPLPQAVTVGSTGASFFFNATVQTASGGGWLQSTCDGQLFSTSSGPGYSTPGACSISVNAATLPAGIYAGQVVFSSGSTAMTVPVTLNVVGAGLPFFGGFAGGLNFVSGSGFSPASQEAQINNPGTGVLNWTAAVSRTGTANWLSVSATSGAAPSIVTVSVSPQGLSAGIYLGQVLFQAASGSITIPVSLVVVDGSISTFQQMPSINFTMPVGSNPLSQTVTVVSTGTTGASFFFDATAQTAGGGAWLQSSCDGQLFSTSSGSRYSAPGACSVGVNAATLPAGIYAGQVVFSNGSTAMIVPVTLTVEGVGVPFFGGVAGGLSFVSGTGFSPAPQNVQLNNAGIGALNWTAAVSMFRTSTVVTAGQFTDVNWLSVSATSGAAPSIVTVSVSPQGLPAGIYLGQVLFQAANSSVTVPVSLVVVDSTISTFQQMPGVNFTMPVGSNPLPQTVTVVSTGTTGASVFFDATAQTAGGAWLQSACDGQLFSTSSGSRYSAPGACSISVNAATLPAGIYAGQVVFSDGSTAMIVPVTLTVEGAGVPFFGGVAGGLSFVSGSGFSPAPQNVQLNNAGTGALNWTAAVSMFRTSTVVTGGQFTDVNWLSVSAASGIAPSIVTVTVSPQGLPTGIYLGQILFQAVGSSVTVPVSLVVVDNSISTFQQMPGVNFTMPVGSNPLPQTVTVVSTGTSFFFDVTAQTAGGGAWLRSTCNGQLFSTSSGSRYSTPGVCPISVNGATLPTGIYVGQVVFNNGSTAMTLPVNLTVGNPGSAPTITQVLNATGEAATISQNTWVEIKGANLAQGTQDWSSQTSFAQGLLPTSVAGVSATVNNKPAFIYYVSPTQVNILTPLDTATGAVTVKLTTPLSSAPITAGATMVPNALGIFTANFTGNLYPSAYHAVSTCSTKYNGVCLLGPPTLYPGLSTPAVPGETIVLYGNGFGPVNPPLVNGVAFPPATALPTLPSITIGGLPAKVDYAGIVSAGLYQFDVEVPAATPDGDNLLVVTYNGVKTQGNVFVTVKK